MVRSAVVGAPMTDIQAHAADTSDSPELPPARRFEADSDLAPVIRSKIQPPPLRSTTLTRQRLIDRLHESTASRVTLLIAEAGYGKTTLLADFAARSGKRTLWYRLDPTDADAITWTNYLIAACREVDPTFGTATLRLLSESRGTNPPRSAVLEMLAGEFVAWSAAPTALVLDDFHRVDRSAEACEVVYRLIETAPPWLHLVISTRRRPPLELARLAVAGELAEITSEELRFSDAETSRLFAECYGRPLERDVVRTIEQRTRGWAASLALVYGSIREKSSQATMSLAEALSGASAPIYDFLAEEVMAAVPGDLESALMRASLLDSINVDAMLAVLGSDPKPPGAAQVLALLDEAEQFGLISRTSHSSARREMHPLLRDFLAVRLKDRAGPKAVQKLHRDVAVALSATEPLVACRHFIDAGDSSSAMAVLEASILKTLGSGQWGLAADLIDRLRDTPPGPGVAAIRARQLMDDGDLVAAERLLESVQSRNVEPSVRSALRQTELALGWRTGNRDLIRTAAQTLLVDEETPGSVREIAQLFVDADLDAAHPSTLIALASRFAHMSQSQAAGGLDFFSAVALHNSSVAYLAAADYEACLDAAGRSLAAFSRLHPQPAEALSTHSIVAVALMELGRETEAQRHVEASAEKNRELADVPALIAVAYLAAGRTDEARVLIARAQALEKQGRGDVAGAEVTEIAAAFALLADSPSEAIEVLDRASIPPVLDLGLNLERRTMLAHAYLAAGQPSKCLEVASAALEESRRRGANRSELRLAVLVAVALEDRSSLAAAIRTAGGASRLALSELADVICRRLDLAEPSINELGPAISAHPDRWLPLLRQALGQGAPTGHHAASLLDAYGEARDIGVLRAYARTYRSRGAAPKLGLALAQRTSPRLRIRDLGRVTLEIADRSIALGGIRRKPAALLLYLASRSAYTAHRDQVIDDLWPDADPASAINSLNQSLYFLRREIEPWYEDGVSPDYVGFAGDLVWLDADLVTSDGARFLAAAQTWKQGSQSDSLELLRSYTGHFAPEFEYEEWALSFRSKLRSKFLEVAAGSVSRLIRAGEFEEARVVAVLALEADETASDLERVLVWLHWRLGARSAAKAQYEHLLRTDQLDGLDPAPLLELVHGPPPLGT